MRIAPCGICCDVCNLFKQERCPGCAAFEAIISEANICRIPRCAQDKGVKYCGDCSDFPCKIYKTQGVPFSESLLEAHTRVHSDQQ